MVNLINFAYLVASVLFILGLKGLTHPRPAGRGARVMRRGHRPAAPSRS